MPYATFYGKVNLELEGSMKPKHKPLRLVMLLILLSAVACSLPRLSAPTPFVYPTPDLTQTALLEFVATAVAQTQGVPTATAIPTQPPPASPTPPPTDTLPPPSATNTQLPPTATSAPVNTPVSRAGTGTFRSPKINAYYIQREPTIDGVFDEWNLERYPADYVVYGADHWSGSEDLSANVMVGWDDYNLYIAAKVIDDVYAQDASGEDIYKGDEVEVQLDTRLSNDYYTQYLSPDDYQIGSSPGSPQPGTDTYAYLWYPRSIEGSRSQVKIGATKTDNGYRIEVKIPWSVLNITPAKGRHYGFAFSVSDNDRTDKNVQQSMVSTSPRRMLTNPTTWGDLELMGQY